jgi:hypothetical protein
MPLGAWLAGKGARLGARKYDTPAEAESAVRPYVEAWNMSPKLKGVILAALGAGIAAGAQVVEHGGIDPASVKAAAVAAAAGFCVTAGALFRRWSGSPVETGGFFVLGGALTAMAQALSHGGDPRTAGIVGAALAVAYLLQPHPADGKPEQLAPRTPPGLMVLLALLVLPVVAQADEQPVHVTIAASAEATMSDVGSKVTPGASVGVEGPVVIGGHAPLRMFARADLLALPGATTAPDITALDTFSAVRASAGVLRDVGQLQAGGQDVRTSIVGHWSFSTRLGGDPAPLERYARAYGGGLQLAELLGGAYLRIEYGHDDAVAAEFGRGHLLLAGAVPIAHTNGVASIGIEAALGLGHPTGVTAQDRVSIRLLISPPARSGTSTPTPSMPAGDRTPDGAAPVTHQHAPPMLVAGGAAAH